MNIITDWIVRSLAAQAVVGVVCLAGFLVLTRNLSFERSALTALSQTGFNLTAAAGAGLMLVGILKCWRLRRSL